MKRAIYPHLALFGSLVAMFGLASCGGSGEGNGSQSITSPALSAPADQAAAVSTTPSLQWTASTVASGDSVTYDCYLDSNPIPATKMNAAGIAGLSFSIPTSSPLDYAATYYWKVVAKNNHGATAASGVRRFSTIPDTVPPTILSTSPAAGAAEVGAYGEIAATFDEQLTAATVDSNSFYLYQGANTTSHIAGTVSYAGRTATFTPSSHLSFNAAYTATITPAVTDLAGNAMAGFSSWSFTTGSEPGSIDTTFGGSGTGYKGTDFGTTVDAAYSLAIQSDGKIVAAGKTWSYVSGNYDFALARYTADGTPDSNFGPITDPGVLGYGTVTTSVDAAGDAGNSVAIQADGKIVVAGLSTNADTIPNYDFAVVRYNTDGTLDSTFHADGITTTPIGTGDDVANAVAIQSDGKIVAAGTSLVGSFSVFSIVRYTSSGALDTTFGGSGKVTTDFGGGVNSFCNAVAIQTDGKIVVAGDSNYVGFALARYNGNGLLDASFGNGGTVANIGASSTSIYSLAIQSDGKILVAAAGITGTPSGSIIVARINGNGTLDTGFGSTGIVDVLPGLYGGFGRFYDASVLIQSDGKIVVSGDFWAPNSYNPVVARLNADGSPDATFISVDSSGYAIAANNLRAFSSALQADGKIIIGGCNDATYPDFVLIRFMP